MRECVLGLVWEDEPEQSVACRLSLGSPMVTNKPQTPLARKSLEESTASGKIVNVWQRSIPEE